MEFETNSQIYVSDFEFRRRPGAETGWHAMKIEMTKDHNGNGDCFMWQKFMG